MKPRLKSVSAEDVMNSLYYLHLDTPSDAFLIEDMQDRNAAEISIEPSKAPIARKLLHDGTLTDVTVEGPQKVDKGPQTETTLSRAPSGALRFQKVLKPSLPTRPTEEVINRKPPLPQRPPPPPPPEVKNVPVRRPLGPRPYLSQLEMKRKPLPGDENIPPRTDLQPRTLAIEFQARTPQVQVYRSNETLNKTKTSGQDSNSWSSIDEPPVQELFSITLIRRDPTSGAQWNVGKIINESVLDDEVLITEARSSSNKICSSVSVKLTTLGYGQFRAPLIPGKIGGKSTDGFEPKEILGSPDSFDRQVRMVWSKAWERKYKQHLRSSSDQSGAGKGRWMRNSSDISSGLPPRKSAEGGNLGSPRYGVQESGFLSPWNGHCEFSTDTSGRTLKCKHTVANPTITSSPAEPSTGISALVSELRFNLPSSAKSNDSSAPISSNQQPGRFAESKVNKNQNKSSQNTANGRVSSRYPIDYATMYPTADENTPPKPPPTSYAAIYPSDGEDDDDIDELLDLSLGREKAGGGNKGKRAKLGKLIVHDEGLKMLDLIVAANMGIWWTVWER